MGLFGLALDGNTRPQPQALRGRHERPHPAPRHWATMPVRRRSSRRFRHRPDSPATGCCRCGTTSSSTRPATCTSPTTSRGSGGSRPDGTATIWFTDPRLTGLFGFAGGPLGGRIDPTGQWLYVSITVSAEFPLESHDLPGPAGRPSDGSGHGARPPVPVRSRRRRRRRRRPVWPSPSPATCT